MARKLILQSVVKDKDPDVDLHYAKEVLDKPFYDISLTRGPCGHYTIAEMHQDDTLALSSHAVSCLS